MSKPAFDPSKPFEVVEEAASKKKPAFNPNAEFEVVDDPGISKTESALRGTASGVTMSFADEIYGAGKGFIDDVKGIFVDDGSPKVEVQRDEFGRVINTDELNRSSTYEQHRDEYRAADKAAQEANPLTYGGFQIAGGMVSPVNALLPGAAGAKGLAATAKTAKAAGLFSRETAKQIGLMGVGSGVAGGITGAGMSEGNALDVAKDTALGTAVGTGAGLVLGAGGKAAMATARTGMGITRKAVKAVAKYFDPDTLKASAIGATARDLSKKGPNNLKDAIEELNVNEVFAPDVETGLAPDLELVQKRTDTLLETSVRAVKNVIAKVSPETPPTFVDDIDVSEVVAYRNNVAKEIGSTGPKAVEKVDGVIARFQEKLRNGMSLSDLQDEKVRLGNEIRKLGGLKDADSVAEVEAMELLLGKLRTRIEDLADQNLPEELAGFIRKENAKQGAALTALPKIDNKINQEDLQGAAGGLPQIIRFATANTSGAKLLRAQASEAVAPMITAIPRSAAGVKQWAAQNMASIERMNPGLAAQVAQMIKLPPNKMIPLMQPLLQQFGDQFEPSPYPSLMDGKLSDPADRDSHRLHINQNVHDPIQKAKELSALNKDGSVIGGLPE